MGDDGLESGPMVAVAFSACMVALEFPNLANDPCKEGGWKWLIDIFVSKSLRHLCLMAILPCLTIPY